MSTSTQASKGIPNVGGPCAQHHKVSVFHPERAEIVRLIYSDEAGIGDAAVEPVTVVAAVIIHPDQQWDAITGEAEALIEKFVPEEQRANFEFKADKLFARRNLGASGDLLKGFLGIIARFEIPIAAACIDRAFMRAFLLNGAPVGVPESELLPASLPELTQDLSFIACAVAVEMTFQTHFPQEKGLWVADNTRRHGSMRKLLREHQKSPVISSLATTRLDHIVDNIYFGQSSESLGIQLADACNFFIKRHLMGDRAATPFYEIIEPQIAGGPPQAYRGEGIDKVPPL